jgi:hypothetical protein
MSEEKFCHVCHSCVDELYSIKSLVKGSDEIFECCYFCNQTLHGQIEWETSRDRTLIHMNKLANALFYKLSKEADPDG